MPLLNSGHAPPTNNAFRLFLPSSVHRHPVKFTVGASLGACGGGGGAEGFSLFTARARFAKLQSFRLISAQQGKSTPTFCEKKVVIGKIVC